VSDAGLALLAHSLRVDAVTEEVVGALRDAGVEPVLLKGPVLASRLYAPGERPYGDCDLLVAPRDHAAAEAVLGRLGFVRVLRPWDGPGRPEHDAPWEREGSPPVDLHRMLPGVHGVSPEQLHRRLRPHLRTAEVPFAVTALDDPALALLVGLHAAHHRDHPPVLRARPIADLERALQRIPLGTWCAAAALARRLRASAQLARGLHTVAGGADLAVALGLPAPAAEQRSWDRATLRSLVPAPSWLRWAEPDTALARAYLARPLLLLRR
jgi:hypothetical protein